MIDFHNQEPLANAQVYLPVLNRSTITDQKGEFVIDNLCNLNIYLEIYHISCEPYQKEISFETNKPIVFYMEHHLEELEEVAMKTSTVARETVSAQEQTLSAQELTVLSSGTLADAISTMGGVSTISTGGGIVKPVIRGLTGSRIITMNNGVRMQDMEWGDEHAPALDLNSATSVKVVKGASSLRYGSDAIAGIIVLDAKFPKLIDTISGNVNLSGQTNGRGGSVSATIAKSTAKGWFFNSQGSYKRLGDFEAPEYVLSNTGLRQVGFNAHGGFNNFEKGFEIHYSFFDTSLGILRAAHIGNSDDLITAINSQEPNVVNPFTYEIDNPFQEVQHHLVKAEFFKRFAGLGKLDVQYDFQFNDRKEYDIRRGGRSEIPAMDLDLTTHTATANFTWDSLDDFVIETGLLGRYQINFPNPDTGVRRFIPDYDKYEAGAYATGRMDFSEKISVEAGLRYDLHYINAKKFYLDTRWEERNYDEDFFDIIVGDDEFGIELLTNPEFTFHNWAFSGGMQYQPNPENSLSFNYSLAQRPPNPAELFSDGLHHSAARIELGDLRNGQETAHRLSLTYVLRKDRFKLKVEPFFNPIEDFIQLETVGLQLSIRGAFPVWEYQQVDATWYGADVSSSVQWNDQLSSDHIFSFIKGYNRTEDLPLFDIPQINITQTLRYNVPSINASASIGSRLFLQQNETPPNFFVFSQLAQEEVLLRINDAPKGYHLLDFTFSKHFTLSNRNNLILNALGTNVLDTAFRNYTSRLRYFADGIGRNISLQLIYNF
ncbi:TonB-dependent receptor [Gangjinia marincola]|uniref:TonB-dependent receptor n=1 Tax=Gangjinia marincola TaxID=578463 RepID=A0ABN1MD11_9FLAO